MSESYIEVFERLQQSKIKHPTPTNKKPSRLTLLNIHTETKVFQPRSLEGTMDQSQSHIEELAKAIKGSPDGLLDAPIDVWWDGMRWVVIDGHHRLDAYRLHNKKIKGTVKVRVKAHIEMPINEAVMFAAKQNSQDKLAMSKGDKYNTAWHFVCLDIGSKEEQAKAASISERTVATMRSTFKRLRDKQNSKEDLVNLFWGEARLLDRGEFEPDHSLEALEKQAQEVARRLSKALGPIVSRPNVIARGLQIYSKSLPMMLMESFAWSDDFEELSVIMKAEGVMMDDDGDDISDF